MPASSTTSSTFDQRRIADLEKELFSTEVKLDVLKELLRQSEQGRKELFNRNAWLEERIKKLENPKNSPYHLMSWQAKIIFTIRKFKRPLQLKEITAELLVMDAKTQALDYQGDNFISVFLAKAVKIGKLHIEKVRGTRGAYYALPEWLDENGELPVKMVREML